MTFRRTEARGKRLKDWKTKPIFSRRMSASSSSVKEAMFLPSMKYSPEVGVSKAPKICIRVDLPEPEGPMMATNSPSFTEKVTPFKACVEASPPSP